MCAPQLPSLAFAIYCARLALNRANAYENKQAVSSGKKEAEKKQTSAGTDFSHGSHSLVAAKASSSLRYRMC